MKKRYANKHRNFGDLSARVTEAIAASAPAVFLPPGNHYLENSVSIAAGTSNFQIIGAPGQTNIIKTYSATTACFVIGTETVGSTSATVTGVSKGATSVTPASGSLAANTYYIYEGASKARHPEDTGSTYMQPIYNGIVKTSGSTNNFAVAFSRAIPAESVTFKAVTASVGLGISGVSIQCNGAIQGIYAASTDGFTISSVVATGWTDIGVYLKWATNYTITDCDTQVSADSVSSLKYGMSFVGSSRGAITRPVGRIPNRKVAIFSCGCADTDVTGGIVVGDVENAYDTHGSGSDDIVFTNCTGSMLAGNPSWRRGDTNIKFVGCTGREMVIGPGTTATFENCTSPQAVIMSSIGGTVTDATQTPKIGPRTGVFTNCTIGTVTHNDWSGSTNQRMFGSLTFTECTIGDASAVGSIGSVGAPLSAMPSAIATSLTLTDCDFGSATAGLTLTGGISITIAANDNSGTFAGAMITLSASMSATVSGSGNAVTGDTITGGSVSGTIGK